MAAPVVNKKFEDEHEDSGVDEAASMNKMVPGKNDFKKMNQVTP
jgi:sialic acid synthase SpsE